MTPFPFARFSNLAGTVDIFPPFLLNSNIHQLFSPSRSPGAVCNLHVISLLTSVDKGGPLCRSVTTIFSKNTEKLTDAVSAKATRCLSRYEIPGITWHSSMCFSLSNASLCLQSFVDLLHHSWQSQQVLGLPTALALFVLVTFFFLIYIYFEHLKSITIFSYLHLFVLLVKMSAFPVYRWSHSHLDKLFFPPFPTSVMLLSLDGNPSETSLGKYSEIHRGRLCHISSRFRVWLSYVMFWLDSLCLSCVVRQREGDNIVPAFF